MEAELRQVVQAVQVVVEALVAKQAMERAVALLDRDMMEALDWLQKKAEAEAELAL
jgi:hypothetical protein